MRSPLHVVSSIQGKLVIGFGGLIVLTLAAGFYLFQQLSSVQETLLSAQTVLGSSSQSGLGIVMNSHGALTTVKETLLLLLLVFAVAVPVVAYFLVHPIVRSLRKLRRTVETMTDDGKQPATRAGDELGQLAAGFNFMSEQVYKSITVAMSEKEKLITVLESIGDGVVVLDNERQISMVNATTEQVSGFSRRELLGKPYNELLKFIFENDGKENIGFIEQVYAKGVKSEITNHTALVRKDGQHVSVVDSAVPLINETGAVSGCVVVFRDVNQERKVERMKDEFISLASHQLRTPLTAAKWITTRLLKPKTGDLNDEQKGMLNDVQDSLVRLISLVNDLLNLSRIESGKIEVKPEPTDMYELAESVAKEMGHIFETRLQKVQVWKASELPPPNVDPQLIRQVLINLYSNAAKYTPEQGRIEVAVYLEERELMVSVTDTGLGIPKTDQGQVFERFFRASNVTSNGSEGTGLGLYLVRQIVEISGGRIWFESTEGTGTTFWVALPLQGSELREGGLSLQGDPIV